MNMMKKRADLHWYYQKCQEKVLRALTAEKSIEQKCEEYMQKIEDRLIKVEVDVQKRATIQQLDDAINKINEKISNLEKPTAGATTGTAGHEIPPLATIEDTVKERTSELRERERRANNIMAFNIPELKSNLKDEISQHDKNYFLKMTNDVCKQSIQEEEIADIRRLGQPREGRTRPLRITLTSNKPKGMLFRNLQKLRESDYDIRIDSDMTKAEREENKKLFSELKEREKEDKSGEYFYRIRGPPWERKIVKIKKNQD